MKHLIIMLSLCCIVNGETLFQIDPTDEIDGMPASIWINTINTNINKHLEGIATKMLSNKYKERSSAKSLMINAFDKCMLLDSGVTTNEPGLYLQLFTYHIIMLGEKINDNKNHPGHFEAYLLCKEYLKHIWMIHYTVPDHMIYTIDITEGGRVGYKLKQFEKYYKDIVLRRVTKIY